MTSHRTRRDDQPAIAGAASGTPDEQQLPGAALLAVQRERHDHDTRTLRALQALTDTALSHLALDALLPELLERLREVMQVDNAAILLLDEATQELEISVARGPEEEVAGRVRIPLGEGFAGRIAATRAPLAVEDLTSYPVGNPLLRERLRSVLGAPLLAGGRVLGVVHVGSATPRRFTEGEVALLEQAADRIARAVERAQLFAAERDANLALRRQASLINLSFEPFFAWSAEGGIVEWNAGAEQLYGYTRAEALGRVSHDLLRTVHPIPPDAIFAALERDGRWTGELHHTTKDGREVLVESRQQTIDLGGQRLILETNRDVTERRRLERQAHEAIREAKERAAQLEAIFAAVADGLFVYDVEGRIVERNPAASALLAAISPPGSEDATIYKRGRQIEGGVRDATGQQLAEEDWPQARVAHGEVLSGPTSVDIRLRRADGQDAYLNVSGAPLRDEDGAIAGSVCLYRDIAERWEMNATLRQRTQDAELANARLRTLVEVLPVGVAIVDASGKPLLVNDAVRQIWGQDLPLAENTAHYGEYVGWRAESGQRIAASEWGLARALGSGAVTVGVECDIQAFDGQRKTILDSAAPLRDEAGAVIGGVSVVVDISEQKQRNERTREALEAFIAISRALVEAPDEDDSNIVRGPRHSAARLEGTPMERPHGESPLARRLAELTRGILGCRIVAISAVEEVDGTLFDRPVAIVGLTPELERKWWDEQLALQPHEVGTGMLPVDRDRMIAGEVFTADLTRPPYEAPNDYGVTAILGAAMRAEGRMVGLLALDFEDPGRQPHAFTSEEIQIAAAVARLGAVVLERDRLLREREAARAEALALTEANRRMDEFLGIAGHELRTPLTTVKANLQLAERRARQALQATPAEPRKRGDERAAGGGKERGPLEQLLRLLDRAAISVERQERLVQDLLDISRISAGRLEYRMERRDLMALVREAVEEQHVNAPERQITLDAPPEPFAVMADADRIGQVLTNYLTNALKYSAPEQPVHVTVRGQDGQVRVEVRDHGPGLSAAQQRHLFERFHRVAGIEVQSGSGVGLGLGLYISRTIVEQHGGRVGVESAPGEGSTFWFMLPLPAIRRGA